MITLRLIMTRYGINYTFRDQCHVSSMFRVKYRWQQQRRIFFHNYTTENILLLLSINTFITIDFQ